MHACPWFNTHTLTTGKVLHFINLPPVSTYTCMYTIIVGNFQGQTFCGPISEHEYYNEAIVDYLYRQCKQQPAATMQNLSM